MSALADVRHLDAVISFNPLRFGLTAVEVTGAAAVLRGILYRWCSPPGSIRHAPSLGLVKPLTQLQGSTFAPEQLDALGDALEREALDEDFVNDCTVTVELAAGGALIVRARVTLVDGRTYPLAVSAAGASSALISIGA